MIGVTKLLCGTVTPGDLLRYGRQTPGMPHHLLQFSTDKRPIVVWNSTRLCNLHCIHCYYEARNRPDPGELTTTEAKAMIDDLAAFGAPVLLFSGGEPILRDDLFELADYASKKGIRAVLSTNGTLITRDVARQIKKAGLGYVGVSLDGIGAHNDKFRGKKGAFEDALKGIRNCIEIGQRVGLRLTITRHNAGDIPSIFDLIEEERIDRACFYHLVYSGRGSKIMEADLSHENTRNTVDLIFQRTLDFHRRNIEKDILTVDNHADGVYLYLKLRQEQPQRAQEVLQLLRWNGGNSSGVGIGEIDHTGYVHPDQFWRQHTFGNVRERRFSEIWMDTSNEVMAGLKNRKSLLKGRCGRCLYVDICNGNFRARAEAVYGDAWAEDPACYLTDAEIGIEVNR
ncbi:MAG: radical SAM protein [Chloroflexi bacterium]|nr:radical SAM protein [Chloroflexota bacterium]